MLQTTFDGHVITCPDRATWLEARRQGIGASDAAAILGVSQWTSPFALYCEKLGLRPSDPAETEAMAWGQILEPIIADRYMQETGRDLVNHGRFTIRRAPHPPFAIATLDREIVGDDRGPGVLEIKTASAFKADEWRDDGAPLPYLVQVQHQLAVTGYAWGALAVLIGGQRFTTVEVERNDRFIARLLEQEEVFWSRLVRQEPPPVDGSDGTRELLLALYPADEGTTIALPAEAAEWDRVRCEAAQVIAEAEARKAEAENKLRAALGTATRGVLGDFSYTWKTQTRKAHDVKESTFRVLRRAKV